MVVNHGKETWTFRGMTMVADPYTKWMDVSGLGPCTRVYSFISIWFLVLTCLFVFVV